MKELLKKWLRQFLCEHKHAHWMHDISCTRRHLSKDVSQEADGVDSETVWFKKYFDCEDCGAKDVCVSYHE